MPDLTPPPRRGTRSIIVTSNFPPVVGGSCQVYAALAEQGRGLVSVLAPRRSFQTGDVLAGAAEFDGAAPYRVHRIDLLRPGQNSGRFRSAVRDGWIMARLLAVLAWICLRERIAVVCIGDLIYGGWLAWPLRHLLRRRVVVYVHGEEMTESAGGLFERWKGAFLRTADTVLAVSSFARDLAVIALGADRGRVRIVPNGVDLSTFHVRPAPADLAERFGLGAGPVLLTVSRLVERKGIDTVLRALPAVAAIVPDVRYLVVGDGPDRSRLQALASEIGVANRVVFAGRVETDELPRVYALGDVFAMPNRRLPSGDNEGFGLVFLEANASGLPVIAGRAGGTADAVIDGETGIVVDGMDTDAVACAAISLLSDDGKRRAMSVNGLAFAATCSWADRFTHYQDAVDSAGITLPASAAPRVHFSMPPPSPAVPQPDAPTLLVIIDAEEQFDWKTFLADAVDVSNMRHLDATSAIYARHGVQPTYMIDYPVATQPDGVEPLRELLARGACTIGAQLHPWVTPPVTHPIIAPAHSYPGNLPEAEERAKLTELTETIERQFGIRPRAYRAGRYGCGPNTHAILRDLGYSVDCSILPCTDLSAGFGPDFSAWTAAPSWIDPGAQLLEVPVTVGLLGPWARMERAPALLGSRGSQRLHLPGILARFGLLERIKLTPEGTSIDDAKRLTRSLATAGQRVFVVTYHSSSLVPGHAPYVRSQADLARFLRWIDEFCAWFLDDFGGRPGTLDGLHRHAIETTRAA